jgi:SP family facilitated glucose transporter-like MFS transporter 8
MYKFISCLLQVLAAFIANLGTINTGLVFGFSAVAIPQLEEAASLKLMKNRPLG